MVGQTDYVLSCICRVDFHETVAIVVKFRFLSVLFNGDIGWIASMIAQFRLLGIYCYSMRDITYIVSMVCIV